MADDKNPTTATRAQDDDATAVRYHSRFFVEVKHETTHASRGNHTFFTVKSLKEYSFLVQYYSKNERSEIQII